MSPTSGGKGEVRPGGRRLVSFTLTVNSRLTLHPGYEHGAKVISLTGNFANLNVSKHLVNYLASAGS